MDPTRESEACFDDEDSIIVDRVSYLDFLPNSIAKSPGKTFNSHSSVT